MDSFSATPCNLNGSETHVDSSTAGNPRIQPSDEMLPHSHRIVGYGSDPFSFHSRPNKEVMPNVASKVDEAYQPVTCTHHHEGRLQSQMQWSSYEILDTQQIQQHQSERSGLHGNVYASQNASNSSFLIPIAPSSCRQSSQDGDSNPSTASAPLMPSIFAPPTASQPTKDISWQEQMASAHLPMQNPHCQICPPSIHHAESAVLGQGSKSPSSERVDELSAATMQSIGEKRPGCSSRSETEVGAMLQPDLFDLPVGLSGNAATLRNLGPWLLDLSNVSTLSYPQSDLGFKYPNSFHPCLPQNSVFSSARNFGNLPGHTGASFDALPYNFDSRATSSSASTSCSSVAARLPAASIVLNRQETDDGNNESSDESDKVIRRGLERHQVTPPLPSPRAEGTNQVKGYRDFRKTKLSETMDIPRIATSAGTSTSTGTIGKTSLRRDAVRDLSVLQPKEDVGGKIRHMCAFPDCGKHFSTRAHLRRHNRVHSILPLLECPHVGCRSTFTRRDNCNQHQRARHPAVLMVNGIQKLP